MANFSGIEIPDWAVACALASWSIIVVWFVYPFVTARKVENASSRLYRAFIGLFTKIFRDEMKLQRDELVKEVRDEVKKAIVIPAVPPIPTVADIVDAVVKQIPAIPTAAQLLDAMKPELKKFIDDAGAIDVEPVIKEVTAEIAKLKFDLTPLIPKFIELLKPELKATIESLSLDELYKAMAKRARDGKGAKVEARSEAIQEVLNEALDNPEDAKAVIDLVNATAPILKKAGVKDDELLENARAVIQARKALKNTKGVGSSSGSSEVPAFAR